MSCAISVWRDLPNGDSLLPFVPVAGVVAGARTKHSQEAGETADAQVALEYLQYVRAELLAGQFS